MSSGNNPVIVSLPCGQVIMLLTCWLKKANLVSIWEFVRKYLQHLVKEICQEKQNHFNTLSLSCATMT
jgi:hypothetical protein